MIFSSSSATMILSAFLSSTSIIQAFVPSFHHSSSILNSRSNSNSQCMRLLYAMPDVQSMKSTEMREELESYGINTQTMIDKSQFETALREARHHYEQTLSDVMASTRPKVKKKPNTVNYNRVRRQANNQDERIYSCDVNNPNPNDHEERFETAFGNRPSQQERDRQRRQKQQQQRQEQQRQQQKQQQFNRQHQQQKKRRHYRASPDPMGPNSNFHDQFNTATAGATKTRVRPPPRRPPRPSPFEQDPLFAHEAQFYGYDDRFHHEEQYAPPPPPPPRPPPPHYEDEYEYKVGNGRTSSYQHRQNYNQQQPPRTYEDPVVESKYQTALQDAYDMKVEDLQRELNSRGISTKYCMVFKDFCHEYAKAIADNKQKKVTKKIKVTKSSSSSSEDDEEEKDAEDESSIFGDDDEYDPSFRDVVMQKYDPSMWI